MTTRVGQELISSFGRYHGYSEKVYNGTNRTSDYLSLSDGTRLAYDLILPTKNGTPPQNPLPVLFKYTPYLRAFTIYDKSGKNNLAELEVMKWYEEALLRFRSWVVPHRNLIDALFRTKWLGEIVKFGYAVVVVERPGTGASFGKYDPSNEAMAGETNEVLNLIAAQKWCDGNIGMYGDSVQAQIQLLLPAPGTRT